MEQKEIKVLDKGFVRLVGSMGDDAAIVQAARVSYGLGTKTVSEDRGLIRYLMKNHHTSPFEMVEFKFHCKLPIFCARQMVRHRTACLAEGTYIYFDLPSGIEKRGNQLYKIKIEDLWEKFYGKETEAVRDFKKKRIINSKLRQVNEENLEIQHTSIKDIFRNGKKKIFRIILKDGKEIEATADHKFLFSDGWNTLSGKAHLFETNGMAVWDIGNYFLYVNGIEEDVPKLYQNKDWLESMYHLQNKKLSEIAEVCAVSTHTIRKWLKSFGLQRRCSFPKGNKPWNTGKKYKSGPRQLTGEHLENIKKARSGPNSNFWKGGMAPERQNIVRWTTQIAHKIHEKNGWTCQLCKEKKSGLRCHHIIPVWADISLARDETNLTTLCEECHKKVNRNELEYVELLNGPPVKAEYVKKPRVPWNKLNFAKLVEIKEIVYVGEKETYDIEVIGPYHNFIANGIVTHNSINEVSGRYSELPEEFYVPEPENIQKQSKNNKQGRGEVFDYDTATLIMAGMKTQAEEAFEHYHLLLKEDVAREIARINLSLSTYTEWYWKMDLHNLFHFLNLRLDSHAQYEMREYAKAIYELIKPIVPVSCEAFEDYVLNAQTFSAQEMALIKKMITMDDFCLTEEETGLSKRELKELRQKLGIE